jgi:hypothetical protein
MVPISTKLATSSSSFVFAVQNDGYSGLPKAMGGYAPLVDTNPYFYNKKG